MQKEEEVKMQIDATQVSTIAAIPVDIGLEKEGQTKRSEGKKCIMKRKLFSNDLFEQNLSQELFNTCSQI